MLPVKAVLFDFDGTLVDSLPEIYGGVAKAVRSFGLEPPSKEEVAAMIGRGVTVLSERVCERLGRSDPAFSKAMLDKILDCWAETNGRLIEFFPGVLDAVAALRAKGVKTALVTNKLRSLTLAFLKERGADGYFDTVVAGDDCEHNKPAPDMLFKALKDLGCYASEAVMVGDSRNDALAARAAGVTAALVETGYNEGVGIAEWAREAGFSRVYPNARIVCERIARLGSLG
jgi:phosphoglycolate phosphatase